MYTYVLLHFEHKNDITIFVKLLYRATSCMVPCILQRDMKVMSRDWTKNLLS